MNVQAIRPGSSVAAYAHWERQLRAGGGAEPEQTPASIERDEPPAPPRPSNQNEREHDRPAEGVVRLLQEGHFKGIAESRLRAKFSRESAQHTGSEFRDQLAELTDAFDALADELPGEYRTKDSSAAVAKAVRAFDKAAVAAAGQYISGDRDTDGLRDALDAAFDGLKSAVSDILMPAPAAAPDAADRPVVAQSDSEAEPEFPREIPSELAVFMSEMTRMFQNAMDKLAGLVSPYSEHLTRVSEAEAQGSAYEKSVTEYSKHRSGSTVPAADTLNWQV